MFGNVMRASGLIHISVSLGNFFKRASIINSLPTGTQGVAATECCDDGPAHSWGVPQSNVMLLHVSSVRSNNIE